MMEAYLQKRDNKMTQTIKSTLESKIFLLEDEKENLHNPNDPYFMWLVGQIDGLKTAIRLITIKGE